LNELEFYLAQNVPAFSKTECIQKKRSTKKHALFISFDPSNGKTTYWKTWIFDSEFIALSKPACLKNQFPIT